MAAGIIILWGRGKATADKIVEAHFLAALNELRVPWPKVVQKISQVFYRLVRIVASCLENGCHYSIAGKSRIHMRRHGDRDGQ